VEIPANSVLVKAGTIVIMGLLLLIPVSLLRELVSERVMHRHAATRQVAGGWGGAQTAGGPLLAIPATSTADPARPTSHEVFIVAHSLDIEVKLNVEDEPRRVGMYDVPVYVAVVRTSGEFDLPTVLPAIRTQHDQLTLHPERARLVLPVGDVGGLRAVSEVDTGLLARALEPVSDLPIRALAAPVQSDADITGARRRFTFEMTLAGTEALDFLPLATSTEVRMESNWPHPGFARGLLPIEREIDADGFKARWRALGVNRGLPTYWIDSPMVSPAQVPDPALGMRAGNLRLPHTPLASGLPVEAFGVLVVQPVDLYVRVERAVKYGGLFIAMSLLALFVWEHLARRRLHPVQYGLLGLALAIFYLLLLALAEHIGFVAAYALATVSLCALLGVYLAGAFASPAAGGAASGAFAVIYGLLYVIVSAEDYALLAGALSLFALLAAAMVLTRRLDWYGVGGSSERRLAPGG
jgi:inner membrane protein